jgi:hypothetical protein
MRLLIVFFIVSLPVSVVGCSYLFFGEVRSTDIWTGFSFSFWFFLAAKDMKRKLRVILLGSLLASLLWVICGLLFIFGQIK